MEVLWKLHLNDPVYSTPIMVSDCLVLACSTKGYMALIDLQTADINAIFNIEAEVFSTPSKLSERMMVFVGSRDNHLYALEINEQS